MEINKTIVIVASIVGLLLSLGIGFIIGHFTVGTVGTDKDKEAIVEYYQRLVEDVQPNGLNEIVRLVDRDRLRKNLLEMTQQPHQAGTANDLASANYVKDAFVSYGLDVVELFDYDVLLDYPDDRLYNNIQILSPASDVETYEIKEDDFNIPSLRDISKPFLAYSMKGAATSDELYYANYCLEDDFKQLKNVGIDITGKIVICKYGRVFRGNKVSMAQSYGAKGVILYDDPINSVPNDQYDYRFPNGEFLPDTGTQRGSTLFSTIGDPLTPMYPATNYAYRLDRNNVDILSKIQAQVVGYEVAYKLFKLIEDNNNPVTINDWKGSMNFTYVYGGKLKDQKSLTINVFNNRDVRKTYNVMGLIKGTVEEDQYVIVGNHRDAWNLGALDPTAGTATILELARVLMTMKKNGSWKPKRSVMFMSWGAEEYGLIGSIEWVEEYQKKLANGVAYLNVDTAVKGNYSFQSAGSPLLKDLLYKVTKTVKHPTGETAYERWFRNNPDTRTNQPAVSPYLGAGSDFMPFAQRVGLPCTDHSFIRDKDHPRYKNVGYASYPAYHTSYETFELMEKFVDPTFEGFRMLSIIITELIRQLTESAVLPFNSVTYAKDLQYEHSLFESQYLTDFQSYGIDMNPLRWAISNFSQNAQNFHDRMESIDTSKYHLVRIYNEQMRSIEKAFVDPNNPERKGFNHMIFAPSTVNSYGSNVYPALADTIYAYKNKPSPQLLESIKQQYSVLINAIQSASFVLKDSADFKRYTN